MPFVNSREEDDSRYYEILHVLVPRYLRVMGDGSESRRREARSQLNDRLGPNASLLSDVRWFHSASFMSLPGYFSINDIDPSSIGLFPIDIASACAVNAMSICGFAESAKILDLCCCPGGKTQMIYDLLENQGNQRKSGNRADVLIVGVDISKTRLHICTSLLNRTARFKVMETSKHCPGAANTDSRNPILPTRYLGESNDDSISAENHNIKEGGKVENKKCTTNPPHLMIFNCDGTKFGEDTMGTLIYDSVVRDCELQHIFERKKTGSILKRKSKILSNVTPLMTDATCNEVEEEDGGRKRRNKSARQRENKMLRLVEKNDFANIFGSANLQSMHTAQQEYNGKVVGHAALRVEAGEENKEIEASLENTNGGQTQALLDEGTFDFVLVDAECSHDGSYRHMRYVSEGPSLLLQEDCTKDQTASTPSHAAVWPGISDNKPSTMSSYVRATCETEREKIVALQKQLLANGFRLLRASADSTASPCLVYSTCSLEKSQNEEVVQWLLDTFEDAELCPLKPTDLCGSPPCKCDDDASKTETKTETGTGTQSLTIERPMVHRDADLLEFRPLVEPLISIAGNMNVIEGRSETIVTACQESEEVGDEENRDLNRALALITLSQPDLLQAVRAREYSDQRCRALLFLLIMLPFLS